MREELARVVGCACDSLDHCTCGAAYLARGGRPAATGQALLHVTNGESAGNTLRQARLGGAVLPWQDTLHEGPVPGGARAALLRTRAAFLSECGWGSRAAILGALERRDRQLLEARHAVLWFEHDLYDQLQLVDALTLAAHAETSLELIVVDSFLGTLPADELAKLWPRRVTATPEVLTAAAAAWDAFREPEPTGLAAWQGEELPFLRPALLRLLEELPSVVDGLSGTERRALQAIANGARTPPAAFVAAQRAEEAPFLGDTWFYRALTAIGRGRARLVETAEGRALPAPPPLSDGAVFSQLELRLTAYGERVLQSEADRVELLAIDRWLGGTHVTPRNLWRWDAGRVVRS
jgi:hypothetical protein